MMSSNKARRYLQHHKQYSMESQNNHQSTNYLLVDELSSPSPPSATTSRKFFGKSQQSSILPIPQICVNNNDDDDDDNGHVNILNEFDQVLDNESKRTSVLRTLSLKQNDSIDYIGIPINQQRSFSFSLGSKPNLATEKQDDIDVDEHTNPLPFKTMKLSATSKSTLSKETFSRLFHSLTFRSGNHSTSKLTVAKTDSEHLCLTCQNHSNLDIIPKHKKRPSIFGVFASKLNTPPTENSSNRCSSCKKSLSKSISNNNNDNQQLSPSKTLRDQKQLFLHIKRRQSLPSLFHNLLESSSSTVFNQNVIDNINHEQQQHQHQLQSSILSHSTTSLTESDDNNDNNSLKRQRINYDDSSQLTEKCGNKDENDNEIILDNGESHDLNNMNSNDLTTENNNTNQQFLHPPEHKTRSLLTNVFRTRRSNLTLDSNEPNMVGKQFSVSVLNLATSRSSSRRNSAIATINELTLDQRKHALSEENLPSMDNTYIYFTDINGQNFKEKLKYSTTSENTTLREMLVKLFEKHNLSIETYNICLRSAPTLPLSLDQPVKHVLLNDLVVTAFIASFIYCT
ncbi:unnamed protein product [Adineta steineri]|uniref:Uncharacterized protein n=1 Tax=Adineta steineri TaxID=433720 RepID=A0A815EGA6_9BILA|nr:unnamed protein product [Adineta steineri]